MINVHFKKDILWAAFLITVLIFFFSRGTLASSEESQGNKTQYIGGWGLPSRDYIDQYGINYARVGYSALRIEKVPNNIFLTIGMGYRIEKKTYRSFEDYLSQAEEISKLSVKIKNVIAISQDDFSGWWERYANKNPKRFFLVWQKIKQISNNVFYGATIYEDDFEKLSPEELIIIGNHIDLVHFYLHDRNNLNKYDTYLEYLNTYFPKAKIILGIYHQDRRDYEKRYVSIDDELGLFETQLNTCFDLLEEERIDGIEFYPGRLGNAEKIIRERKISGESLYIFNKMTENIKNRLNQKFPRPIEEPIQ
jgi:hypothetical protein